MTERPPAAGPTAVAAYKAMLRGLIELRPSGLRGRLAMALGKHKSFVSQITNPAYRVPIPVGDLPIIFEICHFSLAERERFLELYRTAHPERARHLSSGGGRPHELRIALPAFRSEALAREIESMLLDLSARIIRLARHAEAAQAGSDSLEEADQPGR